MAYSPPLDSVVGYVILFYVFSLGIVAFVAVTTVEFIVLWLMGWGSFLYSLLTSFVMNLASTIVGIMIGFFSFTDLTVGIFLLLFLISVGIEGAIMLIMNRSKHEMKGVWGLAFISNVLSYILLGTGIYIFFSEVF